MGRLKRRPLPRVVDETILMGETKLVVALSLDYQKVGVYEVPQHVSLSMPGSFRFDYTLNQCVVEGTKVVVSAGK